jgi:Ca-activated chloride channel family protein
MFRPAGAIALVLLSAQAQPPFSTKVEAVRVDVLVTENGQPVRGLTPADFEIRDEGVPQQVDLLSFEQIPLNAILALDMSDSVAGERLEHLRRAGRALVGQLKPDDQCALVTFSHLVSLESKLTYDVATVRAALDRAEPSGDTALRDGTHHGIMLAESDVGRALLIVFSDGMDTASWLTADGVLDTARRSDVVVYGVSVKANGNPRFLRDLAAYTGGSLFEIDSTNNLNALFLRILEEFRQRYLVSYSPRGVSTSGWHRLEVRVKGRKATVKARPGYMASK